MKKILPTLIAFFITQNIFSQGCTVNETIPRDTIVCGENIYLTAYGQGQGVALLSENFNTGTYGPGWASSQQAMWNNPCSPGGVDGTTHIWMGNSGPVPRVLTTTSFNLSSCVNAGVTICFDMLFATQGNNTPCEGPDEPQEGVYLQYSIDNGATWIDINYFDPNGGNDPQLVNWNNWCFAVPAAALTANTKFRWFQDADSGADYDHWGIDNVVIYCNDPSYNIIWTHDGYNAGPVGGTNPTPVAPHSTTSYIVVMSNGTVTCRDTVTVVVVNPTITLNAGNDTVVCTGQCATLNATAKIVQKPAKTPTYQNQEQATITGTPGFPGFPPIIPSTPGTAFLNMDINITNLNLSTVTNGYITSVCINSLNMFLFAGINIFDIWLVCPTGDSILLVKDSTLTGNSLTNTCFVPAGSNITSASSPYTGSYSPNQSFNGLTGCDANGVWSLHFQAIFSGFSLPTGTFNSWSISFNDPEVSYVGNFNWNPTTNMTNPNSLTPTVCPPPTAYTLTVSDTAGCVTQSDVVNVTTQTCCSLTATTTQTQPTCGGSNGSITVSPTPVGPVYLFAWSNGATTPTASGLAAGTYTVTITNQSTPTCTFSTSVTLNSNSTLNVSFSNQVNPTCTGNNGSITVTLAGGTAPYSITVDTGTTPFTFLSPIPGSQNIPGLHAGTVDVSVTDGQGCIATATATLVAPNSVNVSFSNPVNPTCAGNDGSVTVTLAGGTAPYAVTVDTGVTPFTFNSPIAGSQNIPNLHNGTVTVSVTDGAGCTSNASVTLTAPVNCCGLTVSAILVQPTCGQNDGSISLTPAGNSAACTYVWGGGQSTSAITSIGAGNYDVTITDPGFPNCFIDTIFSLNSNSSLSITLTNPVNPTCANNDGSITVNLSGGTAPYNISVDTGGGGAPITFVSPVAGSQAIPGLHAGTYATSVTDAGGCQSNATATLTAPICCTIQATAAVVPPTCGLNNASITVTVSTSGISPYTYSIDGITYQASNTFNNVASGNYNAIAKDANACADTAAVVVPVSTNSLNVTTTPTDITCFGANDGTITTTIVGGNIPYGYVWNNTLTTSSIQTLSAGNYSVTVTDASGCTGTASGSVTEPALLTVSLGNDTTLCEGLLVMLSAPNGFATYLWSTAEATQNIVPLATGAYSVTVTDNNNCTASDAVNVNFVPMPLVDLGDDKIAYEGEHIGIFASINLGNATGGTYNWMPDTLLSCADCQNTVALAIDTITYILIYTDNYGCSASDDIVVNVLPVGDIFWPNAFTPNGDGNNDIFLPFGIGVKQINWQMFNRWGEKVFESNNFFFGCDGTYKAQPLPTGVYVYNAKLVMMNNKERKYKGSVTLIR